MDEDSGRERGGGNHVRGEKGRRADKKKTNVATLKKKS